MSDIDLKPVKRCGRCQHLIPRDFHYCPYCNGTDLVNREIPQVCQEEIVRNSIGTLSATESNTCRNLDNVDDTVNEKNIGKKTLGDNKKGIVIKVLIAFCILFVVILGIIFWPLSNKSNNDIVAFDNVVSVDTVAVEPIVTEDENNDIYDCVSDCDGFYSDNTGTFDAIQIYYKDGKVKAIVEIYRVASFSGYAKYDNGVLQIGGKNDEIQMTLTHDGEGKFSGTYKLKNYGKKEKITITRTSGTNPIRQYKKKEVYTFDVAYPYTYDADKWNHATEGNYCISIDKQRHVVLFDFNSHGKSLFCQEIKYNNVSGNIYSYADGGVNYDLQDGTLLSIFWDGDYNIEIWSDFVSCFGTPSDDENSYTDIMFTKPIRVTGE